MNEATKKEMIELYTQGLSCRKIDSKLGLSHDVTAKMIKKIGISKHNKNIKYVGDSHIQCSKCHEVKEIKEFSLIRREGPLLSYCNRCRNKRKSTSVEKYLTTKYYEIKRKRGKRCGFTISLEYFLNLFHEQKGKCFYTDVQLVVENGIGGNPNSCSLDKIIPEKGYVEGNVVFCAWRINIVKSDLRLDEIEQYMPPFYEKIEKYLNSGILKEDNKNKTEEILKDGYGEIVESLSSVNKNELCKNYCRTNNVFGILLIGINVLYFRQINELFSGFIKENTIGEIFNGNINSFYKTSDTSELQEIFNTIFFKTKRPHEIIVSIFNNLGIDVTEDFKTNAYELSYKDTEKYRR